MTRKLAAAAFDSRIVAGTLLRLGLGAVALAHGLLKVLVYTMPGTVAFFVAHGYPAPLAWLVTAAELAGGLGLLAGVATRWASLGLVPVFAGAAVTVAPNGWVFDAPGGGGWEFPAFLALAALVQSQLGPGAWALGPALARRRRESAERSIPAGQTGRADRAQKRRHEMETREIRRIDVTELADRLRGRARLEVWNVLTDDYFDGRLIPGSRRVPLDRVVRTARAERIAADTELIVYCSGPSCPQSSLAAEKLAAAGYREVRLFHGGLESWAEAGLAFDPLAQAS